MIALPFALLWQQPGLMLRFVVASLGRALLTAVSILLIHQFLSGVLGHGNGWVAAMLARAGVELSLGSLVLLLAIAQAGAVGMAYDSRISEQRILNAVELTTMERLVSHVLGLSVDFFDERTHGELVQSIRQDVSNLRQVMGACTTLIVDLAQTAGFIGVAIRLSPSLALWTFVLVPIAAVPITMVARRTIVASASVRRRSVVIFDMLLQLIQGIRIIKIYEAGPSEAIRTADRARHYFDEVMAMERTRALSRVALDSMSGINMLVVVIVGGLQVRNGTLGWAELLAFFLAARSVQGPLNNINTAWMETQRYGASVAHIEAMLRRVPSVSTDADAVALDAGPGIIEGRDVSFRRGDVEILKDVSFSVRRGETLGIVGPSGSGKTTLLNLIARFYDPSSGSITFDGTDVKRLRLPDVHDRMAMVTQDPFLFMTSIADNIARGRLSATRSEIESAARAAEMHEDILSMPEGYETVVGHGGRTLSRGEAQRVNIARAILKDAPILLLDEATSSLDSYSEARVQRALDHLVPGKLVISVSHRLSTLRGAKTILVLEEGRAAGIGSHEELLRNCAAYQRLWYAQSHEVQEHGGIGGLQESRS